MLWLRIWLVMTIRIPTNTFCLFVHIHVWLMVAIIAPVTWHVHNASWPRHREDDGKMTWQNVWHGRRPTYESSSTTIELLWREDMKIWHAWYMVAQHIESWAIIIRLISQLLFSFGVHPSSYFWDVFWNLDSKLFWNICVEIFGNPPQYWIEILGQMQCHRFSPLAASGFVSQSDKNFWAF